MADRVLTEQEIDEYAKAWRRNRPLMILIVSHRLLQKRVTELEAQASKDSGVERTRESYD